VWVELVGVCVWLMSCVNVHCGLPPRVCPCIACAAQYVCWAKNGGGLQAAEGV